MRDGCGSAPLLAVLALLACATSGSAEVRLAPVFGDHQVLQRDSTVPVWGTAQAGEQVSVAFRDQTHATRAGADGTWMVTLTPLAAGGPDALVVTGSTVVRIEDVLVGEVWLGSGQSNMAVSAGGPAGKGDEVLAGLIARDHPRVRINVEGHSEWRVATAGVAAGLPALPYGFAVTLAASLDLPVGVIVRAMPGTSTDFWISERSLQGDATCRAAIAAYAEDVYPGLKRTYDERLAQWKAAPEGKKEPQPPVPPGQPAKGAERLGKHYNNLIRPLMPYRIRGVLWDQGENRASIPGVDQVAVMGALIRGWRSDWGQGGFPFIYVQKPSGGGCAWDPSDPLTSLADPFSALPPQVPPASAGSARETYVRLLAVPGTAMVMTSDLGGGTHPLKKSSYGRRAAQVALGAVYARPGEIYGPMYASHAVEGGRIRIRFSHVGDGLVRRHGERLQGFSIADASRRFIWADAVIDGETVVVSSPGMAQPAAVRYAWGEAIPWANLFNANGFPAQVFRTDDW